MCFTPNALVLLGCLRVFTMGCLSARKADGSNDSFNNFRRWSVPFKHYAATGSVKTLTITLTCHYARRQREKYLMLTQYFRLKISHLCMKLGHSWSHWKLTYPKQHNVGPYQRGCTPYVFVLICFMIRPRITSSNRSNSKFKQVAPCQPIAFPYTNTCGSKASVGWAL